MLTLYKPLIGFVAMFFFVSQGFSQTYISSELQNSVENDLKQKNEKIIPITRIQPDAVTEPIAEEVIFEGYYSLVDLHADYSMLKLNTSEIESVKNDVNGEFEKKDYKIDPNLKNLYIIDKQSNLIVSHLILQRENGKLNIQCKSCEIPSMIISSETENTLIIEWENQDENLPFNWKLTFLKN